MDQYVYAFNLEEDDGEIFFSFPSLIEIISALPSERVKHMNDVTVIGHAHDAVITALQAYISTRSDLPQPDDPRFVRADGFVRLTPVEAMKLELFKVYQANCVSISDFARRLDKPDTAVRRLLNLRHRSVPAEIEEAFSIFGKRLIHYWDVEQRPSLKGNPERSFSSAG